MKNDITYEYRKTVKRPDLIVGNIELGECTYKVLKDELKTPLSSSRLYHTTDTNQFFYDFKGKRYELNWLGSPIDDSELTKELASIKKDIEELKKNPAGLTDADRELLTKVRTLLEKLNIDDLNSAVDKINGFDTVVDDAKKEIQDLIDNVDSDIDKKVQDAINGKLDGYATEAWVESKKYLTEHQDISGKQDKLTDAQLANLNADHSKYLTEHQSLDGYATEAWVESKKYLTEHQDISGKQDKLTAGTNITIKDNVVSATIPTKTSELTNDSGFLTEITYGSLSNDSDSDSDSEVAHGPVDAAELNTILKSMQEDIDNLSKNAGTSKNENIITVYSNVENPYRTVTYDVEVSKITINETTDGGATFTNGEHYDGFENNTSVTGKIMSMTFTGKENKTLGAMISLTVPSDYNVKIFKYDTVNVIWSTYTFNESTNEGKKTYVRTGDVLTGPLELKVIIYK